MNNTTCPECGSNDLSWSLDDPVFYCSVCGYDAGSDVFYKVDDVVKTEWAVNIQKFEEALNATKSQAA